MKKEHVDVSNSPEQFNLLTPDEQAILCDWIRENFIPIKTINKNSDSYYLHGVFEQTPNGFYINNGMFKQAMRLCGFKVDDVSAEYWKFNVSQKSPAYAIRRTY